MRSLEVVFKRSSLTIFHFLAWVTSQATEGKLLRFIPFHRPNIPIQQEESLKPEDYAPDHPVFFLRTGQGLTIFNGQPTRERHSARGNKWPMLEHRL